MYAEDTNLYKMKKKIRKTCPPLGKHKYIYRVSGEEN